MMIMAKNHLKRINAPKTWPLARKATVFTMRPLPGGHPMEMSMPLNILLRDELQMAETTRDVRMILNTQEVLVNGKRRYKPGAIAGLFDLVSFPALKTTFRIMINDWNQLYTLPVGGEEAGLIPSKVTSKQLLRGGKLQFGFHNGITLLSTMNEVKVGDTLLLTIERKVKAHYPLEKGAFVFITGGKHVGHAGTIEKIENGDITVKSEKSTFTTIKKYTFVLGKEKSAIKIHEA